MITLATEKEKKEIDPFVPLTELFLHLAVILIDFLQQIESFFSFIP